MLQTREWPKAGGILHRSCLLEAIYLLGNNPKKEKGGKKKKKKKKPSTKPYTLAESLENRPVIQARYPFLFLKGRLSLFHFVSFCQKGASHIFPRGSHGFPTSETQAVATGVVPLPEKAVLWI